jgi:type II restriction enzyme
VDLRLDRSLAEPYRSGAQRARVLTQGWVAREGYCLACGSEPLRPTAPNSPALDFRCARCREPYELKSAARPFGRRIVDGEYRTFLNAIRSHDNPNLLLLTYAAERAEVTTFSAVPRQAVSRMTVVPRRPLGPTARRAGWQGCSIDLAGLGPKLRVPIVADGAERPRPDVLVDWHRFDFLAAPKHGARDWLPDILACLRRIPGETFTLAEIYAFEPELRLLHPKNVHIPPKIRQQLQILVRHGFLERLAPGRYRKSERFG